MRIDISLAVESLARFDTSKAKRLEIDGTNAPSRDPAYRVPFGMRNPRTLVLFQCSGLLCTFMDVLNPKTNPSKEVVCSLLEELVFVRCIWGNAEGNGEFDMGTVIEMAAAGVSRGVELRIVKGQAKIDLVDVLELRKHALHVEYGPEIDVYDEED